MQDRAKPVGRSVAGGSSNRAPAALMRCFARLIRWAMVASGTRNARAIWAVVSPPTARRVSATWDGALRGDGERQRVDRLGAEPRQQLPAESAEDARVEERREEQREENQRREGRVDAADPGQADHEDDHAGDRRERGLDEDRGEDLGVSVTPAPRRSATVRAAGVQTPPGRYLASIETISACSARRYGDGDSPRLEDPDPADDEDEVVGSDRGEGERDVEPGGRARAAEPPSTTRSAPPTRRSRASRPPARAGFPCASGGAARR